MRDNFIVNELLSTKEKVFNHDWSKFKIVSKEGHKCPIEINFPDGNIDCDYCNYTNKIKGIN
jgi:hypothetical protein